jgi:hypothetical protein
MGHGRLVAIIVLALIMASVVLKHQKPETPVPHEKYQR